MDVDEVDVVLALGDSVEVVLTAFELLAGANMPRLATFGVAVLLLPTGAPSAAFIESSKFMLELLVRTIAACWITGRTATLPPFQDATVSSPNR